ncbi:hypothetical protein CCGE531_10485 [Rhizobium sp. CCGE531]|nr:hypothetical protein CCGE531_10485 [Rhizobium sp. CCGE531]AYG72756.1 hypothetical protein CCGE532_09910 [Rhizobium sp. CCGE532]
MGGCAAYSRRLGGDVTVYSRSDALVYKSRLNRNLPSAPTKMMTCRQIGAKRASAIFNNSDFAASFIDAASRDQDHG